MKTLRFLSLVLSFAMLFLFCSCTDTAEKLTADFVSEITGEKPGAEFVKAYASFAAELFARARKTGENSLVSPLSVVCALAMAFTGAKGETLSQFEKCFDRSGGLGIDGIDAGIAGTISGLYRSESAYTDAANSIWVKKSPDIRLDGGFIEKNERYFRSDVYAVPFTDRTLEEINGWVSANTDGMIKKILDEVTPDTVMVLINAILFEAKWSRGYSEVRARDFKKADGSVVKVDMMCSDEYTFISSKDAVGFIKNYAGNGYSFVAVLPNGDLSGYLKSFDGDEMTALLSSAKLMTVETGTPVFGYDFEIDLVETLTAMGITDAFGGAADFSGMFETGPEAAISKVIHKTRIEVNTDGTKAAAATAVEMTKSAMPINDPVKVILDRPFLYMIIDNNSNLPMFIGTFEG